MIMKLSIFEVSKSWMVNMEHVVLSLGQISAEGF